MLKVPGGWLADATLSVRTSPHPRFARAEDPIFTALECSRWGRLGFVNRPPAPSQPPELQPCETGATGSQDAMWVPGRTSQLRGIGGPGPTMLGLWWLLALIVTRCQISCADCLIERR